LIRAAIEVRGVVQGVGFRPFVHALATSHRLGGFVRNRGGVVEVEVEGPNASVDGFVRRLRLDAPPLARVEDVIRTAREPRGEREFRIVESAGAADAPAIVPPDIAACAACVDELFDPRGRRYRYPFTSCTACGPRLTVAIAGPYDRERTTFAAFAMCAECASEYGDAADRRFHAQTIACPACGPQLAAIDARGATAATGDDAIAYAADRLRAGDVVAIKGVGGYHLAIDARSDPAAARLRARKRRDDKPFAVMAPDLATAGALVELHADERVALIAPARPIVLARRRAGAAVAGVVAPGSHLLGVMLPGSPLQHLVAAALPGVPLVMTSGNRSDEPIAFADADARVRLAGIADAFVVHDLPIHDRCDDAVVRAVGGTVRVLRRARGYAPAPIASPDGLARPTLAVGGQKKSVFGLADERRAIASHYLGDLDHLPAYRAFAAAIERYQQMTGVRPERVACDRHRDYASTRWARTRGLEVVEVQHHTAHVLACLAEHGADAAPAIGIAFDGTGYGDDGAIWGGEVLIWDGAVMRRDTHLAYVPMPGGEAAVREPWRMAIAHLAAAGADVDAAGAPGSLARDAVLALIVDRFHTPRTSSMGRLFDAVAAVAGVAPPRATFDGHAAMALESCAAGEAPSGEYPLAFGPRGIDASAIVAAAAADARAGVPAGVIARRFHSTVVALIEAACRRARARTGIDRVALSGGVFANGIVLGESIERLAASGFGVIAHRAVPTNDGGLWLGQLAYAAALDRAGVQECA
jgi:hydrogenase maturation protein HypF